MIIIRGLQSDGSNTSSIDQSTQIQNNNNDNIYLIVALCTVSVLLLVLLLVIRNRYNARKLGREINKLNDFIRAADGPSQHSETNIQIEKKLKPIKIPDINTHGNEASSLKNQYALEKSDPDQYMSPITQLKFSRVADEEEEKLKNNHIEVNPSEGNSIHIEPNTRTYNEPNPRTYKKNFHLSIQIPTNQSIK